MKPKLKVLFVCTGNSCRSQMAEGWARALKAEEIEAFSAGVEPHGMNARAVRAMQEAGVDISAHHSKHVDELKHVLFDYVVTVCDHAHEICPISRERRRSFMLASTIRLGLLRARSRKTKRCSTTGECGMRSDHSCRDCHSRWRRIIDENGGSKLLWIRQSAPISVSRRDN